MGEAGLDILGIKRLLCLHVAGCSNVRSGPILELVAVLPATKHLQVLDLSRTGGSSPADSDALCKVARRCLDLAYLGLGGCRAVTSESIKTIKARLATSLTTLDMSGCVELDAADDLRHLKKMPLLSTLSFNGCPALRDGVTKHLPEALTNLDLGGTQVSDIGLERVLANCPKLGTLTLDACCRVTDAGLRGFVARPLEPPLHYLSCAGTLISSDAVRALAATRVGLPCGTDGGAGVMRPLAGSEDAAFRTEHYVLAARREAEATRVQRWCVQRMVVKANMKVFNREMNAARFIQAIYRGFTARRRHVVLLHLRLRACCHIQTEFRHQQGRRRAQVLVRGWRLRHQTRAMAAFREALLQTAETTFRVEAVAERFGARRHLRLWKETLDTTLRNKFATAETHYRHAFLCKHLCAWQVVARATVCRHRALAVVFLACANLAAHNSSPQLSAMSKALRNDYQIKLPLFFGHWLRLRKAELQAHRFIFKIVALLVPRWRTWAADRTRRDRLVAQMAVYHKGAVLKMWRVFNRYKKSRRHELKAARAMFHLKLVRRCFGSTDKNGKGTGWKSLAKEAVAARGNKAAVADAKFAAPRRKKMSSAIFKAWKQAVARIKVERKAMALIQRMALRFLSRMHASEEERAQRKEDARNEVIASAFRRRRSLRRGVGAWKPWAKYNAHWRPVILAKVRRGTQRVHLFAWGWAAKREAAAREIQRIYRGHDARVKTTRYVTQREWAAMVIGRTCRHFLFRRNMGDARRLRRRIMAIRDADRAIREHERMEWEDERANKMRTVQFMAAEIQRTYRGLLGRRAAYARHVQNVRDRAIAEREEALRVKEEADFAAQRRREQRELEERMALRLQNAWRCRNARQLMRFILEFRARTRVAISLQSAYRGRIGRRIGYGDRRTANTAREILAARTSESMILRWVGIRNRRSHTPLRMGQNRARYALRALAISPASFTLWDNLKRELRMDYLDSRFEFEVRVEVLRSQGLDAMLTMKVPKRLDNLFKITPGTAAMVVGLKHELRGETGYVLSVDRSEEIELAELRMDRTGEIKFIPVKTEETLVAPPEQVLVTVQTRDFRAVGRVANFYGIRNRWRHSILKWVDEYRADIIANRRAVTIQSTWRQYAARRDAARRRVEAKLEVAVRMQRAKRLLGMLGIRHASGARLMAYYHWIVRGRYWHHLEGVWVPDDLPHQPMPWAYITDRMMLAARRHQEFRAMVRQWRRQEEVYGRRPNDRSGEGIQTKVAHTDVPLNIGHPMPFRIRTHMMLVTRGISAMMYGGQKSWAGRKKRIMGMRRRHHDLTEPPEPAEPDPGMVR